MHKFQINSCGLDKNLASLFANPLVKVYLSGTPFPFPFPIDVVEEIDYQLYAATTAIYIENLN